MLAAPQELAYETKVVHPPRVAGPKRFQERLKSKSRQKALLLGLVLLAMIIGFGKTFLAVQLVIKGYEVDSIKQEIETLQKENERLQLEVARLKAPERVARVATTHLGMVEPQAGQLYYVPGEAVPGQQVQMAARETGSKGSGTGTEVTAPAHQTWLATLSQALQQWLGPVRVAKVDG